MPEPIVTDDEGKKVEEPKQKPLTKHEADMEALIARREAENAEPIKEPEPTPADPEPAPEVPMIELSDDEGNIIKVPATAKYKSKIDGNEVEVPFKSLTRNYQIGVSADKKMKEAAEKQKELEQKEQELTARGEELSKSEQSYQDQMQKLEKKAASGEVSETDYREKAKKLLEALTDSDNPEDALVDVLKDLSPKIESVDYEKIEAAAEKKAKAAIKAQKEADDAEREAERQKKRDNARLEANARFEKEHKDIIDDPVLYNAAQGFANKIWADAPNKEPWDVITEAVGKVKAWQEQNLKPKTPTPAPTPRSVSSRASIGKDEKKQTRQETLAEMRKSRGQPV